MHFLIDVHTSLLLLKIKRFGCICDRFFETTYKTNSFKLWVINDNEIHGVYLIMGNSIKHNVRHFYSFYLDLVSGSNLATIVDVNEL